jgi:uncharacterized protein YxjI
VNIQKLKQQVIQSRKDGFEDAEIRRAMQQDGVPDETIRRVFHDLNRRTQQQTHQNNQQIQQPQQQNKRQLRGQINQRGQNFRNTVEGVDLTSDEYKVKQKLLSLGNTYHVYDGDELIMKAHQKLLKLKEHIKFTDGDGERIFDVKAEQIFDTAGDYTLIDSETEKPITVLEKKFSIATHKWKIRSADSSEQVLAHVHSESPVLAWLRVIGGYVPFFPNIFALIPHKYIIEAPDETPIGYLEGKFSFRDTYMLDIDQTGQAPKESLVASAIAIDALEGN